MLKIEKLSNRFILLLIILFAVTFDSICCSMIKITQNGITIVGNNEDYYIPNSRIWFEPGVNGNYGAVYVGHDNLYPQGGMNEAGLVFDGFTASYKEIKDTAGKQYISPLDLEKKILQECATVEEVKNLVSRYNISFWSAGVLIFVDRTGKYLYIDGDDLIIGQDEYIIQTNRHLLEHKGCQRFEKASRILESRRNTSVDFCKSVMDSIHQEGNWGGTQYTTIYDLNNGVVHLYYFHNFENVITFNLKEELKKGNRVLNIPELFPGNENGNKYVISYNNILFPLSKLGDNQLADEIASLKSVKDSINNSPLLKQIWLSEIGDFGDSFLDKKNYRSAIRYFKLNTELFPDIWYVYDNLGEAYMKNKQYRLALDNYLQSVKINPDNAPAKEQIDKLKRLVDE